MSSRERNLLLALLAMVFVGGNLLAYKRWYEPRMVRLESLIRQKEEEAERDGGVGNTVDALQNDIDWLTEKEPAPTRAANVKTELAALATREASNSNLTVEKKNFGTSITDEKLNYHLARYSMTVSGSEQNIYNWINAVHEPEKFRAVTYTKIIVLPDDATKARCSIFLDQWYVPETI